MSAFFRHITRIFPRNLPVHKNGSYAIRVKIARYAYVHTGLVTQEQRFLSQQILVESSNYSSICLAVYNSRDFSICVVTVSNRNFISISIDYLINAVDIILENIYHIIIFIPHHIIQSCNTAEALSTGICQVPLFALSKNKINKGQPTSPFGYCQPLCRSDVYGPRCSPRPRAA